MENNEQEEKKFTFQHHFLTSSDERELTPRRSRSMKITEETTTLETTKLNSSIGSEQHASSASSVSSMPSGFHQKPWPSRKAAHAEELIKHMSKLPSYLQHMGRGANIQEKALNFGVLDWGLLEKWISHKKSVASGRGEISSCSCKESSSFSAFGSSIHSHISTGSPIPRRKQDGLQNPSVTGSLTKLMERKSSEDDLEFRDSRTSATKFSTGHGQCLDADRRPSANCTPFKHSKDKRENSGSKVKSHNISLPQESSTSCSTSKYDDTLAFTNKAVEAEEGRSKKTEQKQYPTLLQNKECMWDHLEQTVHVRRSSFDYLISIIDGMPAERYRSSFSGSFPEDAQTTYQSPHVPCSCPLLCTILTDEPDSASGILQENEVSIIKPEGRNGKHDQFTCGSSEQFQVGRVDKSGQGEVKATSATGRKLANHPSVASPSSMSRSPWEGSSSARQSKSVAFPDKSDGDKAAANNRGRYRPLRRILDPVLKPKHHIYPSGPVAASPVLNSHWLNDTDKPLTREELASPHASDTAIGFSWQSSGNLNFSSQMPDSSRGSLLDEGQLASTKHALLQLAWKNGLPLFMFSSSDGDILAAAVSKKSVSNQDGCECIYTMFSVHEVEKKSGVWINPGNKTKKHGLLSHVVGRLKVSCSMLADHDSKSHYHVLRELVLFGAELPPTSHESVGSLFSSELAAIITVDLQEMPESSGVHLTRSSKCEYEYSSPTKSAEQGCYFWPGKDPQVDKNNEDSSLSRVVAILPSGIHGLPDEGEPSPLIQRWKSGGACDCGGWDEGCMLTILTNNQEKRSSCLEQACCYTDGTHRFELFAKGGSRESKHAFRMVSSKEGRLYAVDFRSSVDLLQAFAISMAILHSRNPTIRAVEAESLQEYICCENVGKPPSCN